MVCTRKTKTLVSTCVILSGMTNIVCLLYVGWVTNYIASVYVKVQEPISEKKLEEDKGDTLRIIERLDHLENVIKQHIQGTFPPLAFPLTSPKLCATLHPLSPRLACVCVCVCASCSRHCFVFVACFCQNGLPRGEFLFSSPCKPGSASPCGERVRAGVLQVFPQCCCSGGSHLGF